MFRCCLKHSSYLRLNRFIKKNNRNGVCVRTYNDFVNEGLLPAHSPGAVEKGKYEQWMKDELFKANNNAGSKKVFSMILPPPNVTGSLHLGHTLTASIQDALARYKRSDFNVLWLPGTDHAGIATQVAVEKYIQKQTGKTRHDLGRENFIEEVWRWRKKYGSRILQQLKSMGCSLDWSRETFTMNDEHSKAVKAAFVRLFDDGLIYRSEDLVNWCCHLQTTISDIEVNHVQVKGPTELSLPGYDEPILFGILYFVSYKLSDGSGEVRVATTRPETILGDVALAVNPSDERNTRHIGRRVFHPITGEELPIVADESVDPNFGSGVLKLTPAHDRLDFRIAKKFGLESKRIIGDDGLICDGFGNFSFMKRLHARKAVLELLIQKQLLIEQIPHIYSVPVCSRTGDVIELIPKLQWFISCRDMDTELLTAIEQGQIVLEPDSYKKDLQIWLAKSKGWCISRQLWWGHRVPAYHCSAGENTNVWVAAESMEEAATKASKKLGVPKASITCKQDEDVLDTWFSSCLYPFSSLGWPALTDDYRTFYPLSVMITGHDIFLFWVYRMLILGKRLTGEYPFAKILLHGVICDDKGAKMSKSKGNVIKPEDVARGANFKKLLGRLQSFKDEGVLGNDEYEKSLSVLKDEYPQGFPENGYDALRFTLCNSNFKSKFINFNADECRTNSLFCNKIWNSVKYTRHSVSVVADYSSNALPTLNMFDRWILSRLATLTQVVSTSFESLDLFDATSALKKFLYSDLCDLYLETTKPAIWAVRKKETASKADISAALGHCDTLITCLDISLKCLHPFMPFITTELLPKIPHIQDGKIFYKSLDNKIVQQSQTVESWRDLDSERDVEELKDVIEGARYLKSSYQTPEGHKPVMVVETTDSRLGENVNKYESVLKLICGVSSFSTDISSLSDPSNFVIQRVMSDVCTVHMIKPNAELSEEELERYTIREQRLAKKVIALESRITSPSYKVTKETHDEHMEKIASWTSELNQIRKIINR